MSQIDKIDTRALHRLDTDLSTQSIESFIERIRQHFELTNCVYHCPSFAGHSLADPYVTTTYQPEWTSHYRGQGYVSIDPVVNIGARSMVPFDWNRLARETKEVKRLFGEAKDGGVGHQGLTIPVRGPTNGHWALFTATSNESDSVWGGRRHELIKDLLLIAHSVHQRAYDLHTPATLLNLNVITRREIEALQFAAERQTLDTTAISMRISTTTARAHLDSARHKLQALNRVHAVTKAMRAGLIH
jgi:DNA-binding CsgD family transcriptional regulator